MGKKKNQIVFKRHLFWNYFYRPIVHLMALFQGYKVKSHFKMEKGQSYIILSNHQGGVDGLFLPLSFNRHMYGVLTDSFLSKGWVAKMFQHQLGIIGKKKGAVDVSANMEMMRVIREGGTLLIFPEGNRSYAEFQFSLTEGFSKFIRFFKKPIILFNLHGGAGVDPRFGKKRRKGPFYGEIKRVLQPEEYESWSDDEFYKVISENLRVFDSSSGNKYKSKERAEYLERMFFICPKCGKLEALYSRGYLFHPDQGAPAGADRLDRHPAAMLHAVFGTGDGGHQLVGHALLSVLQGRGATRPRVLRVDASGAVCRIRGIPAVLPAFQEQRGDVFLERLLHVWRLCVFRHPPGILHVVYLRVRDQQQPSAAYRAAKVRQGSGAEARDADGVSVVLL